MLGFLRLCTLRMCSESVSQCSGKPAASSHRPIFPRLPSPDPYANEIEQAGSQQFWLSWWDSQQPNGNRNDEEARKKCQKGALPLGEGSEVLGGREGAGQESTDRIAPSVND